MALLAGRLPYSNSRTVPTLTERTLPAEVAISFPFFQMRLCGIECDRDAYERMDIVAGRSQTLLLPIPVWMCSDSQNHYHFPFGLIRLHDAVRLPDVLEAEHARRLSLVTACLHVGRDRLQWYVRQGEARLPEHEAGEEGQVDAARHLRQRVEVGARRQAAQPPGQACTAAPAQHGEGIEDGAVADQVED